MVTLDKIAAGITKYIDAEMIPHLSGIRKIGLGVYAGLAATNLGSMAQKYIHHPAVEVLNVVHDDGSIDIDTLYKSVLPMFANGQTESIMIPMIGEWKIDKTDIEKLYRYIKE